MHLAHRDAFEKAGILHGDISDGNIVIYYDQDDPDVPASGLLIDWDLCSYTDELDQEPCQKGRSVRLPCSTMRAYAYSSH